LCLLIRPFTCFFSVSVASGHALMVHFLACPEAVSLLSSTSAPSPDACLRISAFWLRNSFCSWRTCAKSKLISHVAVVVVAVVSVVFFMLYLYLYGHYGRPFVGSFAVWYYYTHPGFGDSKRLSHLSNKVENKAISKIVAIPSHLTSCTNASQKRFYYRK
jgi:hypothetical protein